MVTDHINYANPENEGDHTMIASDNFINSNVILGSSKIEARTNFDQNFLAVFKCIPVSALFCAPVVVGLYAFKQQLYLALIVS